MKFAHMADVHIGSWKDPKLKDMSTEAFIKAVSICIEKKVDFILIAGDLFNTALPGIDGLKSVVKEFKVLRDKGISVYVIPGSHDYSPSGKTMIDVLEEAGLLKNVFKGKVVDGKIQLRFTKDEKTGAKITGILGRRGTLEKLYYQELDLEHLEKEQGKKIFMFHTSITELKPGSKSVMDSTDVSYMPKNFEYYSGGHVHIVNKYSFKDHKNVVYPGPLFPANFEELEELGVGGFFIYNDTLIHHGDSHFERIDINIKNTLPIKIDCNHKSPEEVYQMILDKITGKELLNTIVLIRVAGTLKTGKVSDINFKELFLKCYAQGAFYVMRNTVKVLSSEYEELRIEDYSPEDIEESMIKEHIGQIKVSGFTSEKELVITKELMHFLSSEKHEGEKVYEYDDRIKKDIDKLLEL
ncbi:MAG TPA: exonuclease SbcCD subunit D [Alphaproteobacteria bacterium]|nr:exonuclease SbcCD subunit D [Alphaproteobacteria bacterium]